jgi:hypothetical protein
MVAFDPDNIRIYETWVAGKAAKGSSDDGGMGGKRSSSNNDPAR